MPWTRPTLPGSAMGQPTHAFDLDKIEGGIVVRRARKGEKLKTLDGMERMLDPEDLVVADHAKALGAGRRDGRLGHDDYAGDEERAGRGGVVRSHGRSPHGAAPRPAHRRKPSLRARSGLQRGPACLGAREQHSAGQWRLDRRRTCGCARRRASKRSTAQRKPIALALSEVQRILGKTVDEEGIDCRDRRGRACWRWGAGLASQRGRWLRGR